jgi:acid phosphatase
MIGKGLRYLSRRTVLRAGIRTVAALPFLRGGRALAAEGELPFLVVGDWGRYGGLKQRDIARQMGREAAAIGSRFVLSVGDNFYETGVASVDDPHFQASFEQVYDARSLQTPWYIALGNHDYKGNVEAQVAYSGKSTRWHMPARYFTQSRMLPDGEALDLFFLDTCPFVARYRGTDVRIEGQDSRAQLAWLEAALAKSTARWKLAVGHHPVFSGGRDHGSTPELIRDVKPLLERFGVHAYFFGHDHDLQHIVVNGVSYIGCGAGSDSRPTSKIDGSRFAGDRPGFFSGRFSADALRFSFIDYSGETLYRAEV